MNTKEDKAIDVQLKRGRVLGEHATKIAVDLQKGRRPPTPATPPQVLPEFLQFVTI